MKRLTRVRWEADDSQRWDIYRRAIVIAIVGNLLLAVAKGFLAWLSGSSAIFSDAANSLSDTLYSLLMGLGLYISQKPADESHPQGHSQFEPLISLVIAIAMGGAGVVAAWQSYQRFLGGAKAIELGLSTVVLVGAVIVKAIMYLIMRKIGKKAQSPAIKATAQDNLVDVLSSTAALIGVWGARFIHPVFDPIAGLFVAVWIFRATGEILWENFGYLTGRGASEELTEQIVKIASRISGVQNVHHVIAEYIGPQLRVDMHIDVDGDIKLKNAHVIDEEIREKVEAMTEVDLVFVHIDPVN